MLCLTDMCCDNFSQLLHSHRRVTDKMNTNGGLDILPNSSRCACMWERKNFALHILRNFSSLVFPEEWAHVKISKENLRRLHG